MKENVRDPTGLYLCIDFYYQIFISTSDNDDWCNWKSWRVETLSKTKSDEKTWAIYKTQTSFQITGDEIEPLDLKFHLFCGDLAKTTNFGWLMFDVELETHSAASYFVENHSKSIIIT